MKKIFVLLLLLFPFIVDAKIDPEELPTLKEKMLEDNVAYSDKIASEYVTNSNGIDFTQTSGDNNGKGLYYTTDFNTNVGVDKIYYYRGNVNNNNVIFGGYCWKIVRTTEQGGTRLIYAGVPNVVDGRLQCTDISGNALSGMYIGSSRYTPSGSSGFQYFSYMYTRDMYDIEIEETESVDTINGDSYYISYGDSYDFKSTYSTGYTIKNNDGSPVQRCLISECYNELTNMFYYNTSESASNTYTIYTDVSPIKKITSVTYDSDSNSWVIHYIKYNSSFNRERKLNTNELSSDVKEKVDAWYNDNLINYSKYIEDSIYCNDRTISYNNGASTYTTSYVRATSGTPTLNCSNENDSFTVSSSNGNGDLTYPIGLLTIDELLLAGYTTSTTSTDIYLHGPVSWTMSPYGIYSGNSHYFIYTYNTRIDDDYSYHSRYSRPAISLKDDVKVLQGSGSIDNPYLIRTIKESNIIINNDNSKGTLLIDNTENIEEGLDVSFTINPIVGYHVSNINIIDSNNNTITYQASENEYSFEMPNNDVTISVNYEINKSSINVEVKNETKDLIIYIEDLDMVPYNEEVVFNVTPIKGYRIVDIEIVDSLGHNIEFNRTSNNEYVFNMPEYDVTIIPSYSKVTSIVNAGNSEHTKEIIIEVNDTSAVFYEDIVVFKVIPEEGYEVSDIIITDENDNKIEFRNTSNTNEYEFVMPDTDVTIQPIYSKLPELPDTNNKIDNPKTGNNYLDVFIPLLLISGAFYIIVKNKKNYI